MTDPRFQSGNDGECGKYIITKDFPKARLFKVQFSAWWHRWMYVRIANAAELYVGWLHLSWRMPYLASTAYQKGYQKGFSDGLAYKEAA